MLFDLPSLNCKTGSTKSTPEHHRFKIATPMSSLGEVIGKISKDMDIHYVSAGSWALHDLLRYVIQQVGPADVLGFTWSITQPAADQLVDMIQKGEIKSLSIVMDGKMSKWSRGASVYLKDHCRDFRIVGCHAKGFWLHSEKMDVSVVSSANFSNNPRIEAGVISTQEGVCDFHHEWIADLLVSGDPFEDKDFSLQGEKVSAPGNPEKVLYLISGPAGCCKTTLGNTIADVVVDGKDVFTIKGEYLQERRKETREVSHVQNVVITSMDSGIKKIAATGRFTKRKEIDFLRKVAQKNGYCFFQIEIKGGRSGVKK